MCRGYIKYQSAIFGDAVVFVHILILMGFSHFLIISVNANEAMYHVNITVNISNVNIFLIF